METMLKFLEDPELDAPDAKNLRCILAHQIHKTLPSADDEKLCRWIQSQIVLGFVPLDNIASLLEVVNSPRNSRQGALSREAFYEKVIEGVQRCTICGSSELKQVTLNTILIFMSCGTLSSKLESLGWELIRTAISVQSRLIDEGICAFMDALISAETARRSSTVNGTDETQGIAKLMKTIGSFPLQLAEACVISASKALINRVATLYQLDDSQDIERPLERKLHLELLSKWWLSLQGSGVLSGIQERPGWQTVEQILGSQAHDVLITYMRLMDQRSRCLFLIRHCYVPEPSHKGYKIPGEQVDLKVLAEAQFKDISEEHPDRSPFTNLLLTLRLANKHGVGNVHRIFDIIRALGLSGTTIVMVMTHDVSHVTMDAQVVLEEIKYYLQRNEPRIAYRIFQACALLPLEHVPALADAIIGNPDLYTHTALYYRHRRQRWLESKHFNSDPKHTMQLRTELLNRMAHAYARSPHHPGISFRQVYKCYLALRTDGLPVTAEITKALTYAGIIRYLKVGAWVSTVRYNRIWSLVKEAEGQKVADRLDHLVFFWRGKVLDQNMYRKRKERAMGLPRGSLLTDEMLERLHANTLPREAQLTSKTRRQKMHWYKKEKVTDPYECLRAGDLGDDE